MLGRMGAAARALELIIGRLADVPAAIAFVQGQADEELWQHLIALALQDPESTGACNATAINRNQMTDASFPSIRRMSAFLADDDRGGASSRWRCGPRSPQARPLAGQTGWLRDNARVS